MHTLISPQRMSTLVVPDTNHEKEPNVGSSPNFEVDEVDSQEDER